MSKLIEELPEGFRMTELGPLPVDWEVVRLGEVAKTIKGRKPQQLSEDLKEEFIPYLTAEYFRTKNVSKFVSKDVKNFIKVNEDDIVFIWDGSNAGDVFTGLSGALASTMIKIDPEGNINKKFLYYYLKTKFLLFNTKTTGSTIPHVNKNLFYNLPVSLPPLPEQQKIASILSTVQNAKEKTEAVINAAKDLKRSMMKHLFTYGPVSPQDAENVPLKESEIGMVPEEWEVSTFEEISKIITDYVANGSFASLKENVEYKNEENYAILLRLLDYSNHFKGPFVYITESAYNFLSKTKLKVNDIILSNVGARLGTVFRVPDLNKPMSLGPNAVLIQTKFSDDFYYYYLSSDYGQKAIWSIATKTAQPKFNKTDLRNLKVPLPPFSEQQKIASILSTIDQKIETEENVKKALEDLFKTLLHNLMTAKIRVNHLEVET